MEVQLLCFHNFVPFVVQISLELVLVFLFWFEVKAQDVLLLVLIQLTDF